MANGLKRQIRQRASRSNEERAAYDQSNHDSSDPVAPPVSSDISPQAVTASQFDTPDRASDNHCTDHNQSSCDNHIHKSIGIQGSDAAVFMFYVEKVFPFLFPFYQPSLADGGKAWIFELTLTRPIVRQVALCQGLYFSLAAASGTASSLSTWGQVLTQTQDAFGILRKALRYMEGSHIADHLRGAVRVFASIVQLQRFENSVLTSENWPMHLNAALALFQQLLDVPGDGTAASPKSRFNTITKRLGHCSRNSFDEPSQTSAAEQAAFHFSASLLVFDDILAATSLQKRPVLYQLQHDLLEGSDGTEPPIDLEAVIGVRNCVLLQISEITALDAWKRQCKVAGNLDVMELAHRAMVISIPLRHETEVDPRNDATQNSNPLDAVAACACFSSGLSTNVRSSITRMWAHAALLYLHVVVSGWQLANADVRHHVDIFVDLLRHVSPALVRTMAWPFCVAGCLAEPTQEAHFRAVLETLPSSIFGTVHNAFQVMEMVWRDRDAPGNESRDLAACFRIQDNPILLV
ncbi:MAG: hypothetical protein Q9159_003539 [Coniocarpon cinnabarinum]